MEKKEYLLHQVWITEVKGFWTKKIRTNSLILRVLAENETEARQLFAKDCALNVPTWEYGKCSEVCCVLMSDLPLVGAQ